MLVYQIWNFKMTLFKIYNKLLMKKKIKLQKKLNLNIKMTNYLQTFSLINKKNIKIKIKVKKMI